MSVLLNSTKSDKRSQSRVLLLRAVALCMGLVFALGLCEVLLRLHNPFPFRVKANRIVLPINQKYVFKNTHIEKLSSEIIHTKNSLGFRGEEPPKNWNEHLKIITVGGSTTESFLLNDGTDWPSQLGALLRKRTTNVWVNNAGLDGQSTFGHQVLLDDYLVKLKPDFALFLVGHNDVGVADLNRYEKYMLYGSQSTFKRILLKSEIVVTGINVWRAMMGPQRELGHLRMDLTTYKHHASDGNPAAQELEKHRTPIVEYGARLKRMIETCRKAGIKPVFITQPVLYGSGTDDVTGVNLETVAITPTQSGKTRWLILEAYNEALRNICRSNSVPFVDLAVLLPKSSKYYYDWAHFTEAGAKKVAEIVDAEAFGNSNILRSPEPQKSGLIGDKK